MNGVKCTLEIISIRTGNVTVYYRWIDSMGEKAYVNLHINRSGTLIAQRYADVILKSHIIPNVAAIDDFLLLIHDNARYHKTRWKNVFQMEIVQYMEWLICFPYQEYVVHTRTTQFIETNASVDWIFLLVEWSKIF